MASEEKDLRNAVKNAKSAFYTYKVKKRKQTRKESRRTSRTLKKKKQHEFQLKKYNAEATTVAPSQQPKKKRKRKKRKKKEEEATSESLTYEQECYNAANNSDEKLISSLGKKLGVNKRRKSSMFKEDGLDYILEVCEPLTGESKGYSSDEEYLASKSRRAKDVKSKRVKDVKSKDGDVELNAKDISNKLLFEDGNEEDMEEVLEGEGFDGDFDEGDEDEEVLERNDVEEDIECGSEDEDAEEHEDDEEVEKGENGEEEEEKGENGEEEEEDEEEEEEDEIVSCSNLKSKKKISSNNLDKSVSKYIPPALRELQTKDIDQQKIYESRIKKKLKGLLNRVSEGTLQGIISQIENLYSTNSRNFMNEVLYEMISDVCVATVSTPEKLVLQTMIIIAALHSSGSEVASYFLEMLAKRFSHLHRQSPSYGEGKTIHNILLIFTSLYNLKVVHCVLIYDLVTLCLKTFTDQDIELIFLVLKSCGAGIRKDDPGALKDFIVAVQTKSAERKGDGEQSYINFMLETINALKNNNMKKIPMYDASTVEDARKCLKNTTQGKTQTSASQLKISLPDLLDADGKGRWWITGSAWSGRGPVENKSNPDDDKPKESDFNAAILQAAKKQRMNTNLRKQIFCIMLSSEDYIDAFEKLLKLNLSEKQSREIIHVLVDCCLQERTYNPFYAHLANKFCEFDKSHHVTLQYNIWDRFKTISTMKKYNQLNLAQFLSHMIASKSLSLSVLKAVSFGALDKTCVTFFSNFFNTFLLRYPENCVKAAFHRISSTPKLSLLRQGVKLFLRHFLSPDEDAPGVVDINKEKMKQMIEVAESALDGCDYVPL